MAELVYALVLGTSGATLGSSSLPPGTLDFCINKCYTSLMFKINKIKITNNITYSVVGGLGILFIFALSVVATIMVLTPIKANAQDCINYYWPAPSYGNNNSYYNNGHCSGYSTNTINPMPIVYAVTPNSANAVSGNMAVIITGANFVPGSMAKWNNLYRSTMFTDAGRLTVILTAADLEKSGSFVISISNPPPGGGNSNGVFFTVNPYVVPSVASAAPISYNAPAPKPVTVAKIAKTTSKETNDSYAGLAANALFGTNSFIPSSLIQWLFFAILILVAVILVRKFYIKDIERPLKHL